MIRYDIPIELYHKSPIVSHSMLRDFYVKGPRYFAANHVMPYMKGGKLLTSPYETLRLAADASGEVESTGLAKREDGTLVVANTNDGEEKLTGKQKALAEKAAKKRQSFVDGQAFEDKLVEPHEFDKRYAIKPYGMTFSTKAGKEFRAKALAEGKSIITEAYYDHMMEMVTAIQENDFACELLHACRKQPTIYVDYPGVPGLQARPDYFNPDGLPCTDMLPYTLDLKTTIALQRLTSGQATGENGYHRQGGIGCEALRRHDPRRFEQVIVYLLAVEKNNPHRVQVVELDHDSWIVPGWKWAEEQLERLAMYYARGEWPRTEEEYVKSYGKPWQVNKGYSVDEASEDEDAEDEAA